MPLEVEGYRLGFARLTSAGGRSIRVALVNNMPDTALAATEAQFCGLLQAAAGGRSVPGTSVVLPGIAALARGAGAPRPLVLAPR